MLCGKGRFQPTGRLSSTSIYCAISSTSCAAFAAFEMENTMASCLPWAKLRINRGARANTTRCSDDKREESAMEKNRVQNKKGEAAEELRAQQEYLMEMGGVFSTRGKHAIHCLTVIGQIEGHSLAPQSQKTTKYEHVIPQLAELIAGVSKPSATLVLGGGHSIGIPLAVSAQRSFIVPSATMTVHPVRHSGLVLGVPQTLRYFEQMQQRITRFVTGHSAISAERFTQLMLHTGELVMDMGSVLEGEMAVREGLIDELGGLHEALRYLYRAIEKGKKKPSKNA